MQPISLVVREVEWPHPLPALSHTLPATKSGAKKRRSKRFLSCSEPTLTCLPCAQVQVDRERILTISGQRESSSSSQLPSGFRRQERSVGTFQRQFRLPLSANPSAITAKAENGVLAVEIPKLESEVSPVTNIAIA